MSHTAHIHISEGSPRRLQIEGELDFEDAPRISELAMQLLTEGERPLRVDTRELDFMDSSGLSALVRCATEARRLGTYVCLIGTPGQTRRLLQRTGLEDMFHYEDPSAPLFCGDGSAPPALPESFEMELPPDTSALALARDRILHIIEGRGLSADTRDDILLALGEAIANAIRHGCPKADPDCTIHLRVRFKPEGLLVEVTDGGPGFDPATIPDPDVTTLKNGGMGLFFMRSVMDTVSHRQSKRGHTVVMTKQLAGEATPSD